MDCISIMMRCNMWQGLVQTNPRGTIFFTFTQVAGCYPQRCLTLKNKVAYYQAIANNARRHTLLVWITTSLKNP